MFYRAQVPWLTIERLPKDDDISLPELKPATDEAAVQTDPPPVVVDGTHREPSNSTPMGVNPISSGSPHVRCTPMGRTCGEPDEIKTHTHPKNITALTTLFFFLVARRLPDGPAPRGTRRDGAGLPDGPTAYPAAAGERQGNILVC